VPHRHHDFFFFCFFFSFSFFFLIGAARVKKWPGERHGTISGLKDYGALGIVAWMPI